MSKKKTEVTSSLTQPSNVIKADIKGNESGKTANLLGGFVQLYYHESILQDSVRADFIYADAGNTINGKSAMEGLPIVGTEDFTLTFLDNNEEKLEFSEENKNTFIVNKVTPREVDTAKEIITLSLVSEEFIKNEEGGTRIKEVMKGKLSDHVKDILEKKLETEKDITDIEETKNDYNFVGNNKKPFWTMNWLSKFGVPKDEGEQGKTAGFFFWETSEGYHFKSIDAMFAQEAKKRFLFNSSPDKEGLPAGYDGKILQLESDNRIDYQNKIRMGAFGTKLVIFNPFNCMYEVVPQTAEDAEEGTVTAAEGLPKFNKKFKNPLEEDNFTRTTFMYIDAGTLPSGSGEGKEQEQVKKSEEENFEPQKVLNQGIRRYNQFFSQMQTITIPGDFTLHAGDAIYVDSPSIQSETKDDVNRESGGLYIIADLCHYVSSKETFTKMNLVRDSFGRKAESASV